MVDMVSLFAMDWPRHWRNSRTDDAIKILQTMNKNKSFSIYYETAIDFYNHSTDNPEWYEATKAMQPSSKEEYFRNTNNWLDSLR